MAKADTPTTAVAKVAHKLRRLALATKEGELVGSEEDLVAKFKVSRPTLRQAAALVSQEQLLAIRRGVGGGYFSRRPNSRAVAHIAAIYLQTKGATMREIVSAIEPINIEMAVLACRNRDRAMLAKWKAFAERDADVRATGEFRDFQKSQVEFIKLMCATANNHVLELFVLTLYDFCGTTRPEDDLLAPHPDRVREYWARRSELVRAIIQGDAEIATLTARRCAHLIAEWSAKDAARNTRGGEQAWKFPALEGA